MRDDVDQLTVLQKYTSVEPWLDKVTQAADQHKKALGFFAASVFHEYARKEQLYVAIDQDDDGNDIYVGHVLFSCTYPRASVLQMLSLSSHRKKGVATILLEAMKATLTRLEYISIYARVAEDLTDANAFWEKNIFTYNESHPEEIRGRG